MYRSLEKWLSSSYRCWLHIISRLQLLETPLSPSVDICLWRRCCFKELQWIKLKKVINSKFPWSHVALQELPCVERRPVRCLINQADEVLSQRTCSTLLIENRSWEVCLWEKPLGCTDRKEVNWFSLAEGLMHNEASSARVLMATRHLLIGIVVHDEVRNFLEPSVNGFSPGPWLTFGCRVFMVAAEGLWWS